MQRARHEVLVMSIMYIKWGINNIDVCKYLTDIVVMYLCIYGSTVIVDLGRFFSFLILYTVGGARDSVVEWGTMLQAGK
jgi:hypothetical protein